jgi:hypothetical protein
MTTNSSSEPRSGALRYRNEEGEWIVANPGDALYSTLSMIGTEYYTAHGWEAIYLPDDGDDDDVE